MASLLFYAQVFMMVIAGIVGIGFIGWWAYLIARSLESRGKDRTHDNNDDPVL